MATLRRLYILLSCLLVTLVGVGSALPDAAQWQCHHAAHLVTVSAAALPMPCRMAAPMPGMACCPSPPPAAQTAVSTRQALSGLVCHPTLTRLTALPAPGLPGARVLLHRSLLSALPLPAALLTPVPLVRALCPRPPLDVPLCASAPVYAPGLRAPPEHSFFAFADIVHTGEREIVHGFSASYCAAHARAFSLLSAVLPVVCRACGGPDVFVR